MKTPITISDTILEKLDKAQSSANEAEKKVDKLHPYDKTTTLYLGEYD